MNTQENTHNYDSVREKALAASTAAAPHSCNRYDHIMTEWHGQGREERFEVHKLLHEHVLDGEVWETVFTSNSREECETYVASSNLAHTKIVENGVCEVCNMYDKRKADVAQGKQPSFLIVAYGVSRHYGGPEEGGWWYDVTVVLEVRRAHTFEQGLRHARELRDAYPQPRYNRFSCANRGDADVYIRCVYSEADPRMPENGPKGRPTYQ